MSMNSYLMSFGSNNNNVDPFTSFAVKEKRCEITRLINNLNDKQ